MAFLLAFLFIIAGAERVTYARRMRYFGLPDSGIATVTGVVNIVCAWRFCSCRCSRGLFLGTWWLPT